MLYNPSTKEELEEICIRFGLLSGNKPNISKLVEAIAKEEYLKVVLASCPSSVEGLQRESINLGISLIQQGLARIMSAIGRN